VLLSLENAPENRLRMSEIADRIVLSRSALTRSVDKLEAEGYLRRESGAAMMSAAPMPC
jgi:DNA-binding MarR family transcriptional regulator